MPNRTIIWLLSGVALFIAALAPPALAQQPSDEESKLFDEQAQKYFGAAQLAGYDATLKSIASDLAAREQQVIAATRFARFFLDYARVAKTDADFKALELMYPRFKAATNAIMEAGAAAAKGLASKGLDKEITFIDGQLYKLLGDPKMRAVFMTWEAGILAPYGTTPARAATLLDAKPELAQSAIAAMINAPEKVRDRLEKIAPKDVGKYAEGLGDMIFGVGTVVSDVLSARKISLKPIFSIGTGLKQFGEGWGKFFG